MDELTADITAGYTIDGRIETQEEISVSILIPLQIEEEPYEGDYEVIPTDEVQTLATKNMLMTDDVVVNPIPSNYGLITWNGSTLTVS